MKVFEFCKCFCLCRRLCVVLCSGWRLCVLVCVDVLVGVSFSFLSESVSELIRI